MKDQILLKRLAAMMLMGAVGATSIVGCSGDGGLGKAPETTTGGTTTDTDGDGTGIGDDGNTGEDTDFGSVGTLKIIPFKVKETFQDHLSEGAGTVPYFHGSFEYPSVNQYLVQAVNPTTNAATTMAISDVAVFENGSTSDVLKDRESQAFLTQVPYLPITLDIAVIVDASTNLSDADFAKVKTGVSNLFESLKTANFTNVVASNYTLWSYGSKSPFDPDPAGNEAPFWTRAALPQQLNYTGPSIITYTDADLQITNLDLPTVTYGTTTDLDSLKTLIEAVPVVGRSNSTDLNGALMAAIGRYKGAGSTASGTDGGTDEECCNFRDANGNGSSGQFFRKSKLNPEVFDRVDIESNDLYTNYSETGIQMAAVILIASGDDNASRFDQDTVEKTLTAQTISRVFSGADGLSILEKGMPVITAFTGSSSETTTNLQRVSSQFLTTPASSATTAVDLSGVITSLQQEITTRASTNGLYLVNYATPLREGKKVPVQLSFAADTEVKILEGILNPGEVYSEETPNQVVSLGYHSVKPRAVIRGANSEQFSVVQTWNSTAFITPLIDLFFYDYSTTKLGTTWTYCAETIWDMSANESAYNYQWTVTTIAGGTPVAFSTAENCITVDNTTTVDYRVELENTSITPPDVLDLNQDEVFDKYVMANSRVEAVGHKDRLDVLN